MIWIKLLLLCLFLIDALWASFWRWTGPTAWKLAWASHARPSIHYIWCMKTDCFCDPCSLSTSCFYRIHVDRGQQDECSLVHSTLLPSFNYACPATQNEICAMFARNDVKRRPSAQMQLLYLRSELIGDEDKHDNDTSTLRLCYAPCSSEKALNITLICERNYSISCQH